MDDGQSAEKGVFMKTFVIAEIGSAWRFGKNHLANAIDAISVAKWAGADAIKFQFTSDQRLMEQRRNVPEGSYDILAWPEEWIAAIKQQCDEIRIEFMCTVFLKADIAKMNPYVKQWKVASLEAEDDDLIDAIARTGKPVIISTGVLGYVRLPPFMNARLLHCTAAYPTPHDQLNLRAIQRFSGYSDHSCDVLTGALAVACGATVVETHFKLGMTPAGNPDAEHSLSPEFLRWYIDNIRKAEVMLGDGVKRVMPCEEWALKHRVKT